jgi:hypothetical protein
MTSIPHPPWCARTENDGIHRSTPIALQRTGEKLTDVTVFRWQLDERRPLTGIALAFVFGDDHDSHLLDVEQAKALQNALDDLSGV